MEKFTNIFDVYRRIYPLVPLAFVALIFVVDDGVLYRIFPLMMVCSLVAFIFDRDFLTKMARCSVVWAFLGFSGYILFREMVAPGMSWDSFPREIRSWFKVLVFLLAIAYVGRQIAAVNRLFWVIVAASIMGSVVILYGHFANISEYSKVPGYQIGHNSHFFWHTFFGGAYAIVVIICLCLLIYCSQRHLLVLICLSATFSAVMVFLSQSRGAMLSLCLSFCFLMFMHKRRLVAPFLAFLALVVILVIVGKSFLYDPATLLKRKDAYRFALWGHAITQISDSPLFGGGLSAKYSYDTSEAKLVVKPHNLPLTVGIAGGYIGITLFLSIYFAAFRVAYLRRSSPVGGIVATLLLFSFTFHLFDSMKIFYRPTIDWVLLWLPVGLAIALECDGGTKELVVQAPSGSRLEGLPT